MSQANQPSAIPQLLLLLTPEGNLAVELPGFQATRRQITLDTRTAGFALKQMLESQLGQHNIHAIGTNSAPVQQMVEQWHQQYLSKSYPEGISADSVAKVNVEDIGL